MRPKALERKGRLGYHGINKMSSLKLIFGTVNTLPLGMKDCDIEAVYQNGYMPFIGALYNFPEVACTLHFSGHLLSWLERRHAEFIDVLVEMAGRKQLEILGGAFYDPVLPLISRADRVGQIESLTTYLRKMFNRRPRGGWIGESEWEPSLASALRSCGLDYIFLSENHFSAAGIAPQERFEPYVTEDQGKTLTVFPLFDDALGDMDGAEPREILEKIRSLHSAGEERLVTLLVDGRQFGGTEAGHRRWYAEKRFEEFLSLVRDSGAWLEAVHPGRFLRQAVPVRKAYFPCASRTLVLRSALPPAERRLYDARAKNPSVSGNGFFRRFLTRYPESNDLYAKMQYTCALVYQIRGDKYRKAAAQEELWRGQHSAAYWPEPRWGGIYENAFRKSAYRALINAEKLTREQGVFIKSIVPADFDFDHRTEYLYQGNSMNAYVHTLGGRLIELDYLKASWNYLDTMARRREGGEGSSCEDFYSRKTFVDHFFDEETGIDDFDAMSFSRGGFFGNAPFELVRCDRERGELVLEHTGSVSLPSVQGRVRIVKKFIFQDESINLYYTVTNAGQAAVSFVFGCEINFSFLSKKAEDLGIFRSEDEGRFPLSPEKMVLENLSGLVFEDMMNETVLVFSTLEPAQTWSLPVETSSEGGSLEYQSSCIVPRWKITLAPQASWENRLNLRLESRSSSCS
jgi:alpha-amylase